MKGSEDIREFYQSWKEQDIKLTWESVIMGGGVWVALIGTIYYFVI